MFLIGGTVSIPQGFTSVIYIARITTPHSKVVSKPCFPLSDSDHNTQSKHNYRKCVIEIESNKGLGDDAVTLRDISV